MWGGESQTKPNKKSPNHHHQKNPQSKKTHHKPTELFCALSAHISIIILGRCFQENEAVHLPSGFWEAFCSSRAAGSIGDGKKIRLTWGILFNIFNSNADYSLIFPEIDQNEMCVPFICRQIFWICGCHCIVAFLIFQENYMSVSFHLQQLKKYNL